MKPASEPVADYASSNPFLLAMLGIHQIARDVDSWMHDLVPAGVSDLAPEPNEQHSLDLALLGIVAVGRRLGECGHAPADGNDPVVDPMPTDLLR